MIIKSVIAAALLTAIAAPASASVFNIDQARAFCTAGPADDAEHCLSDQKRAGQWLDNWQEIGEYPRFMAKRIVSRCDARYRPDLRQVKFCVEDVRDNRGKSGRRIR